MLHLAWGLEPRTHMQKRGEKLYEKLPQLWRVTAVKNCPRDMGGNRSVLQSSSVFVVYKYDFYIILTKSGKSNAFKPETISPEFWFVQTQPTKSRKRNQTYFNLLVEMLPAIRHLQNC